MMDSFYSQTELLDIGFASVGNGVLISKKASIYSPNSIKIGDNVRIDDFCILSGSITIGNYIHIAAYSAIYGGVKGVFIEDFANISSKVVIYSISDDYSGNSLTNPMIPDKYKNLQSEKVIIEKHVIIGTGCTILPGVILKIGSSIGAMSLVNKTIDPWNVCVGIPARKIKDRSDKLLDLEMKFLEESKRK